MNKPKVIEQLSAQYLDKGWGFGGTGNITVKPLLQQAILMARVDHMPHCFILVRGIKLVGDSGTISNFLRPDLVPRLRVLLEKLLLKP